MPNIISILFYMDSQVTQFKRSSMPESKKSPITLSKIVVTPSFATIQISLKRTGWNNVQQIFEIQHFFIKILAVQTGKRLRLATLKLASLILEQSESAILQDSGLRCLSISAMLWCKWVENKKLILVKKCKLWCKHWCYLFWIKMI